MRKPVAAVIVAAAALALSVALPVIVSAQEQAQGQAQAQVPEGWPVFSSSAVIQYPWEAAFTVRYPAGFESRFDSEQAGIADRDAGVMVAFEIQNFSGSDFEAGTSSYLSIISTSMTPSNLELIRESGYEQFFYASGKSVASSFNGEFDGGDVFVFKGDHAADMFSHRSGRMGFASFVMVREIIKGSYNLSFVCITSIPLSDPGPAGYTSRDNPGVERQCRPFLDSIEFAN